ncbi:MAG TPA: C40 family peptidase [Verrucomicrobiae bacterium]|nr:C40 family peptidase [Verrucomicrobiae bacterium]
MIRDRRRRSARLGAHPERRVLAPVRRAVLRRSAGDAGAVPSLPPQRRSRRRFVVLPPVVNMHAAPRPTSPVVSQAILGTSVLVIRRRSGWALVETPDRYRGWMRSPALRHDRRHMPVVEVRSLLANVYAGQDVTTRAPIAVLPMLARVEISGTAAPALRSAGTRARRAGRVAGAAHEARGGAVGTADWQRIHLPDGRTGWAQTADLHAPVGIAGRHAISRTTGRAAEVVATALRFVGLPYLWGGITTFGLDCSGLVQLAHRAVGVILPRDADLQWADRRLSPVPPGRIRPGDLVFFGPRRGTITHVGIAIGRRAFVNATTRRRPEVRIDRLADPYWKKLFRGARRLPRD